MTKLLWDKAGERIYETGIDHGVLYLEDNRGVAWNGLISIDEEASDDTSEPKYFDGIKYLDTSVIGDFSAKLSAFTYPDEFEEYEGLEEIGNGLYVDNQDTKLFGLSYRTKVGNDTESIEHGYKIHILYNLTCIIDNVTHESITDTITPVTFKWTLNSVPESAIGYRPTGHIILDSRFLPNDILLAIEDILYGYTIFNDSIIYDGGTAFSSGLIIIDGGILTPIYLVYDGGSPGSSEFILIDGGSHSSSGSELPEIEAVEEIYEELPDSGAIESPARLPSINELIQMITFWNPMFIIPQEVTGLAQLISGSGDLTQTKIAGIFYKLPTTRLIDTALPGFSELAV